MTIEISELADGSESWQRCCNIYLRSWPATASGIYSPAEIEARFTQVAELAFWERHIGASHRKLLGSVSKDGTRYHGFSAAELTADGWEYGWLFLEPEAFGSGLATALYDATVAGTSGKWFSYILDGNQMSARFLARRGWVPVAAPQPEWAVALGHHYTRWEMRRQELAASF